MTGHVLVVGAGIAGFGIARALGNRGVRCSIVERLDAAPEAGLGLNLPANAVRALNALGVGDEITRAGRPVTRREYRNQRDRLLFAVDESAFWADIGPSVCLRRSALLDILGSGIAPEDVRWGCPMTSARPVAERVEVRLAAADVETFDYVVGADGVHSSVRPTVVGTADVRPSLMTAASWRFVIRNPGVECWTVWSGSVGTLLLIPVDATHAYGYASTTSRGGAAADPGWLRQTFGTFPDLVRDAVEAALADPSSLYHSPVVEVHADRWSRQRITLIGDAAHAMGPVWGQGAALALEDGLVLAELLHQHREWDEVGEQFETLRRPRVGHVQGATDRMSRLAALPSWLRDLVAPKLGPKAYHGAYGPLRQPFGPTATTGLKPAG